ncbi:MAG: adenine-specific DNA-methyltransferase [Acidobacteriota bacterium]|jgi:adenine-specific DNA-methyltransferase|nr:adenine-specific DNA-methyltransferase [Acidobacteriota bacterium]
MAETNLAKFKKLLSELFMLDRADLDFGIYRILNAKREEITRFLNNDLLPQVKGELETLGTGDRAQAEAEYREALEQAKRFGVAGPEDAPPVIEARMKIEAAVDVATMESEVFSHLFNFFRRYYSEGDFLSLRRYKEGVYAIPYEGEEVKLYWANADQYYIKTSENFRDYIFKLSDERRVHFKLVAADTEQNNNKAAEGQERRFILSETEPLVEENGELLIRFEYRTDADKRKQGDLNAEAVRRLLSAERFGAWIEALRAKAPTEKNPNRTLLEKHLNDYTSRNTFDYFIHKDLGGFLRRELDFYIKNEVMHLDDIESEAAPRVEQYLCKVKAIRRIAHKIIAFLEQLENFEKKLWLKKKFVVETNYCVTLDRVPEDLYVEIAASVAQREEWVRLFAINEIAGNHLILKDFPPPAFSVPLTLEFLKANPFLILDTKFFGQEFKDRLLASFENLDEQTDGLLIHSENFQALNLLQERYREQVKCIYIDPPYNTGSDGFVYKDNYQYSSWLTMLAERIAISEQLLLRRGVFLASIDDNQTDWLKALLQYIFGRSSTLANFVWRRRVSSSMASSWISTDHEYVFVCSPDPTSVEILGAERDMSKYSISDGTGRFYASMPLTVGMNRYQRPNQWYELVNPKTGTGYWPPQNRIWGYYPPTMKLKIEEGKIIWPEDFPDRNMTTPRMKVYPEDAKRDRKPISTWISEKNAESVSDFSEEDVVVLQSGKNEEGTRVLKSFFGEIETIFPKPVSLLTALTQQFVFDGDIVCDYFAGSGTTAHAVINLNREDGNKRKYILVESGSYFDTLLKPRIQRVIYSKDWRDAKPVSRAGSSHLFKYIRLESYEDALNNLELKRTEEQASLFEMYAEFREDYMLRYMLNVEARGSASLLNIENFADPFNYQLNVATGAGVSETRPVTVDLVETFNYLLGLRVKHLDAIHGFRVVEGTNPEGEKVLVIWRNTREKANDHLDQFFQKQGYNTRDRKFDLIYTNGDNNLENLKRADEMWKVRLIEEEFQRLMFDVRDV